MTLSVGVVKVLNKKELVAFIQQVRAKLESVLIRDDKKERFFTINVNGGAVY